MGAERTQPQVQVNRPRCGFCHECVGADDAKQGCPSCMAWSHADCWQEHGGCPACGEGAPPPRAVQRQQAASGNRRPPLQTASRGEFARFVGERRLNSLEPGLALTALKQVFGATAQLSVETEWGFAFRVGSPARLLGRVWLEDHGHGPVVRWEVRDTWFEKGLLLFFMVVGLPTVVVSLFCLWALLGYSSSFMQVRVSRALRGAWNQNEQGQRTLG